MIEAPAQNKPYVFISYASVDRERVFALAGALRESGVAAWIDQADITGGASYGPEITAGIKDSSGDDGNLRYVLKDMANDPSFFGMTGSEILVDSVLAMGAHGVVPGLANVDPHGYVKLWNLMQAGDHAAARLEQERLLKLFEIVWISLGRTSAGSAGVGAFKTAMRSLGIIASNTMARPQRSLNDEETAKVEIILRDVGLLR